MVGFVTEGPQYSADQAEVEVLEVESPGIEVLVLLSSLEIPDIPRPQDDSASLDSLLGNI